MMRLRLRTLLILSHSSIVLILLAITYFTAEWNIKYTLRDLTLQQLKETSHFVAESIDSYLNSALFYLRLFSENLAGIVARGRSLEEAVVFLKAEWERQHYFSSLLLLDPSGRMILSVPFKAPFVGINLSGVYLSGREGDLTTDRFVFTESILSPLLDQPTVCVLFRHPDGPILVAEIDLRKIHVLFTEVPFKEASQVLVMDQNGTVIVSGEWDLVLERRNYGNAGLTSDGFQEIFFRGQNWLSFTATVRSSGWRASILYPSELAFYSYEILVRAIAIGLAFSIVTLAVMILGMSLAITHSLEKIQTGMRTIKEGRTLPQFFFSGPALPIQEFEELKTKFSDLVAAVQSREKDLIRAHQRFETIVDNIPSTVFQVKVQDQKLVLSYVSSTVKKWIDVEHLDLILKNDIHFLIEFIYREDREEFMKKLERSAQFQIPFLWTGRVQTQGTILWAQIHAQRNPAESVETWDGVIEEITHQVRLQETLMQQEKMLMIGSLSAGMAHEIKNPLAAIFQSLEILESVLAKAPSNHPYHNLVFDQLNHIRNSSHRINVIIRDLLAFSRQSDEDKVAANPVEIVQKAYDLFSRSLDVDRYPIFTKVSIQFRTVDTVPKILCSPSLLEQVFINLFSNSLDAFAELQDTNRPLSITITLQRTSGGVQIRFRDNGPGIPDDVKRRIFEPFFTTKRTGQGTGLGLAICYFIIVNAHNGTIDVESFPGMGAEFRIFLPAAHEGSERTTC